jgi:hypothetical protein
MIKRTTAVLAALSLCALAACGGGANNSAGNTSNGAAPANTSK